jgi:hypothetical protein
VTQGEIILRHLKKYGSITSWEAIMEYGITRLSARIYELRKLGYGFLCEQCTQKNRFGENAHFVKYHLIKKENK